MHTSAGTLVNRRYLLQDVLGSGGMGVVYRAHDLQTGDAVAVKLLHDEHADDGDAGRLRAEGAVGAAIRHPNVVTVRDAGVAERGPFVVMQYVAGRSLASELETNGTLSARRAIAIARQLLAALGALHAAGYVHGDVKIDNVLLGRDGDQEVVTLIDLGLCRRIGEQSLVGGCIAGTPEYMAPELIRGEASQIASDLYAVGILLYELVTGRTPFASGSSNAVLCRHLDDEAVPPSRIRPRDGIPGGLERAIMLALAKEPRERFVSAAAFARVLEAAAADAAVTRRPQAEPVDALAMAPTLRWRGPAEVSAPRRRLASGTRPPRP